MQPNLKSNLILWIVIAAAMTLLLSACSMDSSPVSVPVEATSATQEYQYPPFDPNAAANGPEPGFRFVRMRGGAGALDAVNCDPMQASRVCDPWRSNTVVVPLVSVYIPSGVNPTRTTIRIEAASGCVALADFYPHPYQFNGYVQIRWNLNALDLPDHFDYTSLVPYYVTDEGVYERMPYTLSYDHDTLTLYTNHFSRYILGAPVTSGD